MTPEKQEIFDRVWSSKNKPAVQVAEESEGLNLPTQAWEGLKRGVDTTLATGGGLKSMLGSLAGNEELRLRGMESFKSNMESASKRDVAVGTVEEVDWEFGKGAQWATSTIASFLPTMATMLIGGGGGSVIGKKIIGKAITEKAAVNMAKKELRNEIRKKMLIEGMKKEGFKKLALETSKKSAIKSLEKTVDLAIGEEIKKITPKIAMEVAKARLGRAGMQSGIAATSMGMESGSIYGELQELGASADADPDVDYDRPLVALGFGAVAGLLDSVLPMHIANKFGFAGKLKSDVLGRMLKGGLIKKIGTGYVLEGSQEVAQTFIEKAGVSYVDKNKKVFGKDAWSEYTNALAGGGLMGGVAVFATSAKSEGTPPDRGQPLKELKPSEGGTPPPTEREAGSQGSETEMQTQTGEPTENAQEAQESEHDDELNTELSNEFGGLVDDLVGQSVLAGQQARENEMVEGAVQDTYQQEQDALDNAEAEIGNDADQAEHDQQEEELQALAEQETALVEEPATGAEETPIEKLSEPEKIPSWKKMQTLGKPNLLTIAESHDIKAKGKTKKAIIALLNDKAKMTKKRAPKKMRKRLSSSDIKPSKDSLLTAIRKMGINAESATHYGVDKDYVKRNPFTFRKGKNFLDMDMASISLGEMGYLTPDQDGKFDLEELTDLINLEVFGKKQYSRQGIADVVDSQLSEKATKEEEGFKDFQSRAKKARTQEEIESLIDEAENSQDAGILLDEIDSIIGKKSPAIKKTKGKQDKIPFSIREKTTEARKRASQLDAKGQKKLDAIIENNPGEFNRSKYKSVKPEKGYDRLAKYIASKLGYDVVFFENEDTEVTHNGFIDLGGKTIYLNKNGENPIAAIAGHELFHDVTNDAETWKMIDKAFWGKNGLVNENSEWAKKYAKIQKALGNEGVAAKKEFISDLFAEQITDKAFWEKIAGKDNALFNVLAKNLVKIFDNLKSLIVSDTYKASKAIKDINKAQDVLISAMNKYSAKEGGVESSKRDGKFDKMLQEKMPKEASEIKTDQSELLKKQLKAKSDFSRADLKMSKRKIKISELPESAHRILSHTNISSLKSSQNVYDAAKYSNDVMESAKIVGRVTKDSALDEIRDLVKSVGGAYIVPVSGVEDGRYMGNAIPITYAALLSKDSGGEFNSDIYKSSRGSLTGKGGAERISSKIEFKGNVPTDKPIIIVDDVYTSGNTMMALAEYIKDNGGEVVGFSALASGSYGKDIKVNPVEISRIEKKSGLKYEEIKLLLGYEPTNAEIASYNRNGKSGVDGFRIRFLGEVGSEKGVGTSAKTTTDKIANSKRNTETKEFKKWFGNSKVVDESGEPLVVYHGSKNDFDVFDASKIGEQGRAEGTGFYFTSDRLVASGYKGNSGELYSAYLSIKKPLNLDSKPFSENQLKDIIENVAKIESEENGTDLRDGFLSNFGDIDFEGYGSVLSQAIESISDEESALGQMGGMFGAGISAKIVNKAVTDATGYDGVVSDGFGNEGKGGGKIYVAFAPTQIKSVDNKGAFNPSDPNIYNSKRITPLGFYSELESRISDMDFKTIPVKDLSSRISKLKGVKPEEIEWSGINEWLEEKGGKVTKEEVGAFVANNGIGLEEVSKGDYSKEKQEIYDRLERKNKFSSFENWAEADQDTWMSQRGDESQGKYSSYTIPGGENYSEVLLTMPIKPETSPVKLDGVGMDGVVDVPMPGGERYTSAHFDEENILAFARTKERAVDGSPSLFMEEVQSDWHQEGRKEGYNTKEEKKKRSERVKSKKEAKARQDEINEEIMGNGIVSGFSLGGNPVTVSMYDFDTYGIEKGVFVHTTKYNIEEANFVDLKIKARAEGIAEAAVKKDGGKIDDYKDSATKEAEKNTKEYKKQFAKTIDRVRDFPWANKRERKFDTEDSESPALDKLYKEVISSDKYKNFSVDKYKDRYIDDVEREDPTSLVADAPFKKTEAWTSLVLKRMIRKASDDDMESISWTSGEVQADRYDLSKQVDSITYLKHKDGSIDFEVTANGIAKPLIFKRNATKEEVADYVGKEIVDKMERGDGSEARLHPEGFKTLAGVDLKVGGEGMKSYYDKIVPKVASKLGKKWGAKPVQTTITEKGKDYSIWKMDIPIDLKNHALGGQPLFSKRNKLKEKLGSTYDKFGTPEQDPVIKGVLGNIPGVNAVAQFSKEARRKISGTKVVQGMFDQYRQLMLNDIALHGKDVLSKDIANSSYVKARMAGTASNAVQALYEHGKVKVGKDGEITVDEYDKGLIKVFNKLGGEVDQFLKWVAGNRAEALAEEGRENLFGKDDIVKLKALNKGTIGVREKGKFLRKGKMQTVSRASLYNEVLDEFKEYNKAVLDVAEAFGTINKESRKQWESDFYVPFFRIAEENSGKNEPMGPGSAAGLVKQKGIKRLTGGTENIGNLFENVMSNMHYMIDSALKNRAAAKALDTAAKLGIAKRLYTQREVNFLENQMETVVEQAIKFSVQGDLPMPKEKIKALRDKFREIKNNNAPSKNDTYVLDNGEKRYYRLNESEEAQLTLDALSGLDFTGFDSKFISAARWSKRAFTRSVTASPMFIVANGLRDSIHALAVAKISHIPFKSAIEGILPRDKNKLLKARLLAGGGLFSQGYGHALDSETQRKLALKGIERETILDNPESLKGFYNSAKNAIWKPLTTYGAVGDRVENANRIGLALNIMRNGGSLLEAQFEARDILDFSLTGNYNAMRMFAQITPFLNARMQGQYKMGRASVAKPTRKRFASWVGAMTMASIALYLRNRDDEDYKARSDYDKDLYYWAKIGDKAYRVPKPFEVGVITTLAERTFEQLLNTYEGKGFDAKFLANEIAWNIGEQLKFDAIPQIVKPAAEVMFDKNIFTGRPIEGLFMQNLKKTERKKHYTTGTASKISEGVKFLSPLQIDHLVNGYLGWIGTTTTMLADDAYDSMFSENKKPAKPVDRNLLYGRFVRELPSTHTRYVGEFYDYLEEANQIFNSIKNAREVGDLEKETEEREKGGNKLKWTKKLRSVRARMNKYSHRIKMIRNNSSLSADQKKEQIDSVNLQKNDFIKRVVEKVEPDFRNKWFKND